jgi:hypothetical protein
MLLLEHPLSIVQQCWHTVTVVSKRVPDYSKSFMPKLVNDTKLLGDKTLTCKAFFVSTLLTFMGNTMGQCERACENVPPQLRKISNSM